MNLSSQTRRGSNAVLNNRQRPSIPHLATSILVAYLLSSIMIMALPVSAGRITAGTTTSSSSATNSFGPAPASTPLVRLAQMMLDAHVHRVIVVDNEQKPVGIVSSIDILAAVARGGK